MMEWRCSSPVVWVLEAIAVLGVGKGREGVAAAAAIGVAADVAEAD